MGNLGWTHLGCSLDPEWSQLFLAGLPHRSQLGPCLAWVMGPLSCDLSSFSRLVAVLFSWWAHSFKSSKEQAQCMSAVPASACTSLATILIIKAHPMAKSGVSMRKNCPVTWIQMATGQLGAHYCSRPPQCCIKFLFPSKLFERSYIAMNSQEVLSVR